LKKLDGQQRDFYGPILKKANFAFPGEFKMEEWRGELVRAPLEREGERGESGRKKAIWAY
jgi:hypothetical protein